MEQEETMTSPETAGTEPRTAKASAVAFLQAALAGDPVPATEVGRMAREHGLTPKAIRMGREALGVEIERNGFGPGSRSLWSLPGGHIEAASLQPEAQPPGRKKPDEQGTFDMTEEPLPLSERDLRRLANEHGERMDARIKATRGFDRPALDRELQAVLAAEVPPERIEVEFGRVIKYRQTHTSEGFEIIGWPPDETCAHCGKEGLVALVKSPLEGVPDALLHSRHAAVWFGARILEIGGPRPAHRRLERVRIVAAIDARHSLILALGIFGCFAVCEGESPK
jgi:hypothetical protein